MYYFDLCSSIEHTGSEDKGHFAAFVKINNQYYLIDDISKLGRDFVEVILNLVQNSR